MVGIILLSVGIVAIIRGIGAIQLGEAKAREKSFMMSLASQKLDEIIATSDSSQFQQNGDFQDVGERRYTWRTEVNTTSVDNLSAVTITVERADGRNVSVELSATVYVPPTTSTTGGAATP
jgi:hypothetical protein